MTISKRNCLFVLNVIVPLVCGLLIYLTKAESTFLSRSLSAVRSLFPVINYPLFIRCFACDFLWTYSLFFCLRLSLGDELKGKHNITVVLLSSVLSVLLELLQLSKLPIGTFDPFDIVAELLAVAVAFLLTWLIERRNRSHEEKNGLNNLHIFFYLPSFTWKGVIYVLW